MNKETCKKLKKLISKARNDMLRNNVVHGKTDAVTLENLGMAEKALFDIQDYFIKIEQNILQNKAY